MAANVGTLADQDGDSSDWIEIHNPDATPISLEGYHLTDDPEQPDKWTFPSFTLAPNSYLIVFASGKDHTDPEAELHTNFQLAASGDYLALITPDETTAVSEYTPNYPAQFRRESFGLEPANPNPVWQYFQSPTPGAVNRPGDPAGPILLPLETHPTKPTLGPIVLTTEVHELNAPVATVNLFYRQMFDREIRIVMNDAGVDGDEVADDGIWTAAIPDAAFTAGEMTRWRFEARDENGAETKEPAFRDARDAHEYFGTVPHDPAIQTSLPVIHWFIRNPGRAGTSTGSRGALFYQGEFYDNVLFTIHGQSTAAFDKKSYNIDFNRTQRFQWHPDAPRVADIDLLTNWGDKSKVRHVLAYEIMRESGVAAHFAHTVRVQQNGNFFSTADLVEDADEIYLERAGLNKEGALYKVYSNRLDRNAGDRATSGVEKKTRRFENNEDLQTLINNLTLRGSALTDYLYDHIDLPGCINLLAANSVIRNTDMHSKNWYIYRDTGRSDEWTILPWDLDLSHGRAWNRQDTYFDNRLYSQGFVVSGTAIRLVSQLFADRNIRAMILRRIRTLSDQFLQAPPAPGTPEADLYYERRLNEQLRLLDPPTVTPSDAQLDFERWGSWLQRGRDASHTSNATEVESMAEAIERFKTEYLPARRRFIYGSQLVGRGGEIPLAQANGGPTTNTFPLVADRAIAHVRVPTSDALGNDWTGTPAMEPFDTSGWRRGPTGIGYDNGTTYDALIGLDITAEMRRNTSVYIRIEFEAMDPETIQTLELRMKYDDGFIAYLNGEFLASGNAPEPPLWNATTRVAHPANPRRPVLFDVSDKRSALRNGRNILAIHGFNDSLDSRDLLIAPELHGGRILTPTTLEPVLEFGTIEASPASGNQDEEYVQLKNPHQIAVDISDWRITGGIEHSFAPGTVLPPNGTIYVSPNVATFRARTTSPRGGEGLFVQGGYRGHLSSLGETLTLVDKSGTSNTSSSYVGNPSDAQRYLVISELMYHPTNDGRTEYLELLNISDTVTLNLAGIRFTRGIDFAFPDGAPNTLAPGAHLLIVRDRAAFEQRYGSNHLIAGEFANDSALGNGGERIKLEDANNGTILEFVYDDIEPWPNAADGGGPSLVLIDPATRPDPALPENWQASASPNGSPGRSDDSVFPGDPTADRNGNGEADLIDFALGNDLGLPPLYPEFRWLSSPDSADRTLHLIVPVRIPSENFTIQPYFSTDLTTWENGEPHLEHIGTEPLGTEPLGDGRALRTWQVNAPLSTEPKLFMQLRVTAP